MDIKKLKQFFELAGNNPTAITIKNAARAIGQAPEVMPVILTFAEHHNIDIKKELADLTNAQEKASEENTMNETAARLAEMYGLFSKEVDPEKRKELTEKINKTTSVFNTVKQGKKISRFYTADDYFNECRNYDPSKDFTPSMLAGLRFPNSTLSYIGARPGGGKSMILVNLAREAIITKRKVYFVNLEMPYRDIATNYTLSLMYATANDHQREELKKIKDPMSKYYSLFKREYDNRETFDLLRNNAIQEMTRQLEKEMFLFGICETLETLINEIESTANYGDVILVDYLQRVPPPKGYNDRYIQIKQISNALLALALKKGMVIISGAQFGRQVKNNTDKEATLEDFKEGGDIEQDAHNALAIETIIETTTDKEGRYIHVLKQRRGGAKYKYTLIDCNFEYLYMAGTGKEYIKNDESKYEEYTDNNGTKRKRKKS